MDIPEVLIQLAFLQEHRSDRGVRNKIVLLLFSKFVEPVSRQGFIITRK